MRREDVGDGVVIVHAAMLATTTDPAALRRELRRGLAALGAGAVAHGRIVFLAQAIAAALRLRDADEARRLAESLAQGSEPCELVTLFVDLGRTAADVLASDAPGARARLAEVAARAAEAGLGPTCELIAAVMARGACEPLPSERLADSARRRDGGP